MSNLTIYATTWCPYCATLLRGLEGTDFDLIDVDRDPDAAEWVKSVNNGNRVVPTVRYPDGTHATNPPAGEVLRKLGELA
ncbi:mycoredoxin [Corynebacterium pacaense]|uniref:mycoredoxin n=1 Tax=Corynebacterium pacaense TaxID=1816684 RepID=UPI0009BA5C85|nr:mycoredoxin [Corynebacterium pacaense]